MTDKYIVATGNLAHLCIKYAKIIKFVDDGCTERVVVEILGIIDDDDPSELFHVGQIYQMEMWDFKGNYEYINKTELLAKII